MSDDDKNQAAIAMGVKALRDNILAHIEFEQITARLTRAKFLALVGAGFTEQQALDLCKR